MICNNEIITLDYNDGRVKIKTGIWDRVEIYSYNNEYYSYNNNYYIDDDEDYNNDLNDDEENIKVKVIIRINVIIRVKLK